MSTIKQNRGTPAFATTGSTTVATATISAISAQTFYVTDISGSSDRATAVIVVKGGATGATVLWQDRIGNSGGYEHGFIQPLTGTVGGTVSVTVDGVAAANANIAGFYLNNT